jgi:ankyrin repeat protein
MGQLLDQGVNLDARNADGQTVLFDIGDPNLFGVVLELGPDVNLQDNRGNTVAHHNANIHTECDPGIMIGIQELRLLIQQEADFEIRNKAGQTPRDIFERRRNEIMALDWARRIAGDYSEQEQVRMRAELKILDGMIAEVRAAEERRRATHPKPETSQ